MGSRKGIQIKQLDTSRTYYKIIDIQEWVMQGAVRRFVKTCYIT